MIKTENFEMVEVTTSRQLRSWLEKHHHQKESIWLITYKKHMSDKYVSVSQILDEVLCFGWIDGIRDKLAENRTMQLIGTGRTQHWAKSYKTRASKLIQSGRMQPAGLQAIETSKRSGLWNFMDDVDAPIKPVDLETAMSEYPNALHHFEAFPDASKGDILRWIKLAKRSETGKKRIKKRQSWRQKMNEPREVEMKMDDDYKN